MFKTLWNGNSVKRLKVLLGFKEYCIIKVAASWQSLTLVLCKKNKLISLQLPLSEVQYCFLSISGQRAEMFIL